MPPLRRRPRIATVQVLGDRAGKPKHNASRLLLMGQVVEALARRERQWILDAVLFPAGYFWLTQALGPLDGAARAGAIEASALGPPVRAAAVMLAEGAGTLLVAGIDTHPYAKGRSGDQMMAAWRGDQIVGVARKIWPSHLDTRKGARRKLAIFEADAQDPGRMLALPGGGVGMMCVCYDAFVFSELALGPTARRGHLRYLARGDRDWEASAFERNEFLEAFQLLITRSRPNVALIGIHAFEDVGQETFWQRHGVAVASAGLGGSLAASAAHFTRRLPRVDDPWHAPLASFGVEDRHLSRGYYRTALKHWSRDGFYVTVPNQPDLVALVRLFEG